MMNKIKNNLLQPCMDINVQSALQLKKCQQWNTEYSETHIDNYQN